MVRGEEFPGAVSTADCEIGKDEVTYGGVVTYDDIVWRWYEVLKVVACGALP